MTCLRVLLITKTPLLKNASGPYVGESAWQIPHTTLKVYIYVHTNERSLAVRTEAFACSIWLVGCQRERTTCIQIHKLLLLSIVQRCDLISTDLSTLKIFHIQIFHVQTPYWIDCRKNIKVILVWCPGSLAMIFHGSFNYAAASCDRQSVLPNMDATATKRSEKLPKTLPNLHTIILALDQMPCYPKPTLIIKS